MSMRLKQVAVGLVALFAAAQFVRPGRANPPTDESRSIRAHVGNASALAAVLDRACGDCHSNRTAWPWYTQVAPLSWLMAYGVAQGRKALNFSEWAGYPPDQQRQLLEQSCQDVSAGRMPGPIYTALHPEARLSARDIKAICTAAHEVETGRNSP